MRRHIIPISFVCTHGLCGCADIGKTLEKINDVVAREEDLPAEESLISRGCVVPPIVSYTVWLNRPQPGRLHYKEAVERLNAHVLSKPETAVRSL